MRKTGKLMQEIREELDESYPTFTDKTNIVKTADWVSRFTVICQKSP